MVVALCAIDSNAENVFGDRFGNILMFVLAGIKIPSRAPRFGYASPILLPVAAGTSITNPIVVVPFKQKTVGLDLITGNSLWEFPFGKRGTTVNAATPVVTADGKLVPNVEL